MGLRRKTKDKKKGLNRSVGVDAPATRQRTEEKTEISGEFGLLPVFAGDFPVVFLCAARAAGGVSPYTRGRQPLRQGTVFFTAPRQLQA